MNFKTISYTNIKGRCGNYSLTPLVILSGSNRSGKSAFVEALRLGATGRCSLGASRAAMDVVLPSTKANVELATDATQSTWEMKIGDTVSTGGDAVNLQGGMPVTVGDMWALTAEQRMSLIGGKDALEKNASEVLDVRDKIKALTSVIDTPQPQAPPLYAGPSEFELDTKIQALTLKVATHDAHKKQAADALKRLTTTLDELRNQDQELVDTLDTLDGVYKKTQSLQSEIKCSKPGPVWLVGCESVGDILSQVISAFEWVGANTEADMSSLTAAARQRMLEAGDTPIPKNVLKHQKELAEITGGNLELFLKEHQRRVADTKEGIASVRQRIANAEIEIEKLSDNTPNHQIAADLMELDSLKKQLLASHEWSTFERQTKAWAEERAKSVADRDALKSRLDALTAERAEIVGQVKSCIEDKANESLARVGLSPLEIEVVTTAKRASLKVSVNGVAIESLAASERLLYGLCLLHAIQQSSDAPCPILVAECAEMDTEMYKRVIDAIGMPAKGNVVLEHWLQVEGSVIMGN